MKLDKMIVSYLSRPRYHLWDLFGSNTRYIPSSRWQDASPTSDKQKTRNAIQRIIRSSGFSLYGELTSVSISRFCISPLRVRPPCNVEMLQRALVYILGAPKSNPLGKFYIFGTVSDFLIKFTASTDEDSRHAFCKFHCNIWLHSKTYNYLNLNVHFQSEQVLKLAFWLNLTDI